MSLHEFLSKYIFLPIGKMYSGRNFFKANKYKQYLEATQFYPREKLDSLIDMNFRNLIVHCANNVPFYRQYFEKNKLSISDFSVKDDIRKLPLLMRSTLNDNFELFKAQNYHKNEIKLDCTGGTTGEPALFGRDKRNEYIADANNRRFWQYAGCEIGMKTALFWGNPLELNKSDKIYFKLKHFMENVEILNFYDISEQKLNGFIRKLERSNIKLIRGYSSAILFFVKYCLAKKIRINNHLRAIIITADKIYANEKETIKNYFDCEIFEEYGCREFSIIGHECEHADGFHLAEEIFIVEVFNKNTGLLSFQGTGEIVVTSLFNYAMPMIRYHLGDEVTMSSQKCQCGRILKKISDVQGRIGDYVINRKGEYIYGDFFAKMFNIKEIYQYQIIQEQVGELNIHIVKNKLISDHEIKSLINKIIMKNQNFMQINFALRDKIITSASGKRRVIISKLPNFSPY
jgi:phenylacetate-CoA ligase